MSPKDRIDDVVNECWDLFQHNRPFVTWGQALHGVVKLVVLHAYRLGYHHCGEDHVVSTVPPAAESTERFRLVDVFTRHRSLVTGLLTLATTGPGAVALTSVTSGWVCIGLAWVLAAIGAVLLTVHTVFGGRAK